MVGGGGCLSDGMGTIVSVRMGVVSTCCKTKKMTKIK